MLDSHTPGPSPTDTIAWALRTHFDLQPGWEHPSAIPLLADLAPRHAIFRAPPATHCIWEILLHMTVWREAIARGLAGEQTNPEHSWPALPTPAARGESDAVLNPLWQDAIARYRLAHADLLESVAALDPQAPHPHPFYEGHPQWMAALGAQFHDSYHLGEIAMLRGLQGLAHVE